MSITRKHQNSTFSLFYCTYISMALIIFFNTYIHVCHWLGCHMILILWQVKSSSSLFLLPLPPPPPPPHPTPHGRKTKWKQYDTKNIPLHLVNIKWQIGSTFLPPLLPFPLILLSPVFTVNFSWQKKGRIKTEKKSKEREMGETVLNIFWSLEFFKVFQKRKNEDALSTEDIENVAFVLISFHKVCWKNKFLLYLLKNVSILY